MPLIFPTSPTVNQTYQSGSSATYQWNGSFWALAAPPTATVLTATSASRAVTASFALTAAASNAASASFASTASAVNTLRQNVVITGSLTATGTLRSNQSTGFEGGEIELAIPQSDTTINGSVNIDVHRNLVRIFEGGGTSRGAQFNLTACQAAVGSFIAIREGDGSTGYMDIGPIRYQWGSGIGNATGTGAVTFPALFADSNYGLTQTVNSSNDSVAFSITHYNKLTTGYFWRCKFITPGGVAAAGESHTWIAIGLKP